MNPTPDDTRRSARMARGVLARDGFLGTDPRPPADILAADDAEVRRLGVTHALLGERLAAAAEAARAGLGTTVRLGEHLAVTAHEAMGRIPCPWGGCGLFPKGEIDLVDARSGLTLRFTFLSAHLVGTHGFYQGRGSPYRLEPADLCRAFDLP